MASHREISPTCGPSSCCIRPAPQFCNQRLQNCPVGIQNRRIQVDAIDELGEDQGAIEDPRPFRPAQGERSVTDLGEK